VVSRQVQGIPMDRMEDHLKVLTRTLNLHDETLAELRQVRDNPDQKEKLIKVIARLSSQFNYVLVDI